MEKLAQKSTSATPGPPPGMLTLRKGVKIPTLSCCLSLNEHPFSPKGFISTWIITHIAVYLERWDSIHVLFTVQVIWHLCYVTRVISPLTLSPHYKAHRCNWRASLFRFTLT